MTLQTLDRAIGLMKVIASTPQGARLIDLQRHTGWTKPTVHRLLDALCQHGFVAKDEGSKRYVLGTGLGMLAGTMVERSYNLVELCRDHMVEVAQRSGDTSFLTVRSGYDAVCIDRQSGAYPVKAFTVDVGTRRPLGIGAGSLVLLAALGEAERSTIYETIGPKLQRDAHLSVDIIETAVSEAQRVGYAFSDGYVLPEVRGVAVPILDAQGRTIASLSLAAIRERVSPQRLPQLLSILRTHATFIEQRLRQLQVH